MAELVDQYGQPLRRELLEREIAGPTITGVRSPIAGYPADGMNPARLANLLREAAEGEPMPYFELAELIEERDLHYAGVLSTRKRSVAQIDITVEAASDDAEDVRRADMVREWLKRDELQDEMFDILDAVGKGVSFTEIIWDTSEGQFWPERLEWRDPRWFNFDRQTMRKPMLRGGIDGNAVAEPLPAFKFIYHQIKAKSGLPIRSGLARLAAWAWMFKAFTQRDWAIFTQTYAPGRSVAQTVQAMAGKVRNWDYAIAKAYMAKLPRDQADAISDAYRALPSTADDARRFAQAIDQGRPPAGDAPVRTLGLVPADQEAEVSTLTGRSVDGYDFRVSQDAVRHVLDAHGTDQTEAPRGQRAVSADDFGLLPAILSEPDTIEGPDTSNIGETLVHYVKTIGGQRYTATFAVNRTFRSLSLKTLFVRIGK